VSLLPAACRARTVIVEEEVALVATAIAAKNSGKCRKDRTNYQYGGPSYGTKKKYTQIIRMFFNFALVAGCFTVRWQLGPLDEEQWEDIAEHLFRYSGRPKGLSVITLEKYMSMLLHVLIFMGNYTPSMYFCLHRSQQALVQRVMDKFTLRYPECRIIRNTKAAWDDTLVDGALQLLLMWDVYGHTILDCSAWPAFARMSISMLNYLGWRPFSLTTDSADLHDARWYNKPILSFKQCRFAWQDDSIVCVSVFGTRTKFNRNPLFQLGSKGELKDRYIIDGRLTYSTSVDTCPVLAFLVWAIVVGAFGYAPLVGLTCGYVVMGASERLRSHCDMTGADVDALVASIFLLQPEIVPELMQQLAVFTGALLGVQSTSALQVPTSRLSTYVNIVGVLMGLDPSNCSSICARKTSCTAAVSHPEMQDIHLSRMFQHKDPKRTTVVHYLDGSAVPFDSYAVLHKQPCRKLPASCLLAQTRNLWPDMSAAHKAGQNASAVVRAAVHYVAGGVQKHSGAGQLLPYKRRSAYQKAFKAVMQQQFDRQCNMPRVRGCESRTKFFFEPLDVSTLSQAQFVAFSVKKAWGII
jgi:hypothetical protein